MSSRPADILHMRDRAVEIVRLVFLAAPDQLDRRAGEFLGDGDRLVHVVLRAAAPAEAAAEIVPVHLAFRERNAGGFRQRRQRRFEVLRRHPDLGLVGRELHGGVHHLHAGMRRGTASNRSPRPSSRRPRSPRARRRSCARRCSRSAVEALLEVLGDRRARDLARCRPRPRRSAARRARSWRATRCRRPPRRRCPSPSRPSSRPACSAIFASSIAHDLAAEHRRSP